MVRPNSSLLFFLPALHLDFQNQIPQLLNPLLKAFKICIWLNRRYLPIIHYTSIHYYCTYYHYQPKTPQALRKIILCTLSNRSQGLLTLKPTWSRESILNWKRFIPYMWTPIGFHIIIKYYIKRIIIIFEINLEQRIVNYKAIGTDFRKRGFK